jgi:hypothetical protein
MLWLLPLLGLLAFVFGNKVVHSITKRQLKDTWHALAHNTFPKWRSTKSYESIQIFPSISYSVFVYTPNHQYKINPKQVELATQNLGHNQITLSNKRGTLAKTTSTVTDGTLRFAQVGLGCAAPVAILYGMTFLASVLGSALGTNDLFQLLFFVAGAATLGATFAGIEQLGKLKDDRPPVLLSNQRPVVHTGDAAFDDIYEVRGNESFLLSILDHHTRNTLLTLHETMDIHIHNDIIGLYTGRTKQRFDDSAQANKAMQTLQLLEQRFLDKHNEPVAKLIHNIRRDPSVPVKIQNLRCLLRHHRNEPCIDELLSELLDSEEHEIAAFAQMYKNTGSLHNQGQLSLSQYDTPEGTLSLPSPNETDSLSLTSTQEQP